MLSKLYIMVYNQGIWNLS